MITRIAVTLSLAGLLGAGIAPVAVADETASLTVTTATARGFAAPYIPVTACVTASPWKCTSGQTMTEGVVNLTGLPVGESVTVSGGYHGVGAFEDVSITVVPAAGANSAKLTFTSLHIVSGTFTGDTSALRGLELDTVPQAAGMFAPVNRPDVTVSGNRWSATDRTAPYIDENPIYYTYFVGDRQFFSPGTQSFGSQSAVIPAPGMTIAVPTASGSIRGQLVDTKGAPIAGAPVWLGSTATGVRFGALTTDANGYFSATGLFRGRYFAYSGIINNNSELGYAPSLAVDLESGAHAELGTIVGDPVESSGSTGSISLTVKDPQKWYLNSYGHFEGGKWVPLKSKKDVFTPIVTVTNAAGVDFTYDAGVVRGTDSKPFGTVKKVTIAGLKAGTYTVTLVGTSVSKKVKVTAGKRVSAGTLVRPKTVASVVATVRTASGKKTGTSYVRATIGKTSFDLPVRTGGRAATETLVPGTYRLQALVSTDRGLKPIGKVSKFVVKKKKVTKKLTLVVPDAVTVSGTVTDSTGAPQSGIKVVVHPTRSWASTCHGDHDSDVGTAESVTAADGRFSLPVASAKGRYYVSWCDTTTSGRLATQLVRLLTIPGAVTGISLAVS